MTEINIHSLATAREFFSSLASFTQDAKIIFKPERTEVHAECQVPSRIRTSFYTNAITSTKRIEACFRELNRFNIALRLIAEIKGEIQQEKMYITERGDFLIYDDGSLKVKIGTINSTMINRSIATMAVKDDEFDCRFVIPTDKLKLFFTQSALVRSDAAKVYFIMNKDKTISLQLEDKKLTHAGLVAVPINTPENLECEGVFRPVSLSSCTLRSLIKLPGDIITIKLTNNIIVANASYSSGCYYINSGVSIPEQKPE